MVFKAIVKCIFIKDHNRNLSFDWGQHCSYIFHHSFHASKASMTRGTLQDLWTSRSSILSAHTKLHIHWNLLNPAMVEHVTWLFNLPCINPSNEKLNLTWEKLYALECFPRRVGLKTFCWWWVHSITQDNAKKWMVHALIKLLVES